ncbi:MAG: hypothetical protein PVF87_10240 [Acidimicrobiia bacterium]|jgi:hypothetical protein
MSDPENESAPFSFGDAPMGWSSKSPPEPGWYFNAEGTYQAYWDGERWTGVTRPPPPRRTQRSRAPAWLWGLVVVISIGVLVAFALRLIQ